MNSRADVKRQDRLDAEATPNISMQRLASNLEREQRSLKLSRILVFLFVLIWLSLLFGRSLMRQADILDQVYENAAKDSRIQQIRMSNAQLQEEIYGRTDLQAIAAAATQLGMIPSVEAPRILVPQTKNDEVLLRLESADADSFVERSQGARETYYNLEEYYEEHRLAQAYFSNLDPSRYTAEQVLEEFVAGNRALNEDGGIILDGGEGEGSDDASIIDEDATDGSASGDETTSESTTSQTTTSSTTPETVEDPATGENLVDPNTSEPSIGAE